MARPSAAGMDHGPMRGRWRRVVACLPKAERDSDDESLSGRPISRDRGLVPALQPGQRQHFDWQHYVVENGPPLEEDWALKHHPDVGQRCGDAPTTNLHRT